MPHCDSITLKKLWPIALQVCYGVAVEKDMLRAFRTRLRPPTRPNALAAAGFLLLVSAVLAGQSYTVRKNETLTGIARKNGLSVARLAEHNGLERTARLRVGQKLSIPDPEPSPATPAWNPVLPRSLEQIRVSRGKWKYIVLHHSGTPNGSARGMDRYHREQRHMENGLAYHFVIGNGDGMGDGQIAVGQRWTEQLDGGHLRSEAQNKYSIGICLVGNFDRTRPTKKQKESLHALVGHLLDRCGLEPAAVKTHQQINVIGTRCPGQNFPIRTFIRELKQRGR